MQGQEIDNSKALDRLKQLILIVPGGKESLLKDLNASGSALDVRHEAMQVLQKHIFLPKEDWEFEVFSIMSGVPSEKLKILFNLAKLKVALNETMQKLMKK